MMNWNNAFWIWLVAFLAVAFSGIAITTLILKHHADVILEEAKAPPHVAVVPLAAPPVAVAPLAAPPVAVVPPTFDPPKRVGPASSKDCAGLTVAACAAKRKAACEKLSGGKACIASKGHW